MKIDRGLVATLLVGLVLLFGCAKGQKESLRKLDVSKALQEIPEEHQQRLEAFFAKLLLDTSAAYTLYGPKPMSVESYSDNIMTMGTFALYEPGANLALGLGWESWVQYQHLFPSQSFMLRRVPIHSTHPYWYVALLNKPATLQIVGRHLNLFQHVLESAGTPSELMAMIENSDTALEKVINDSVLLGTVLGYGSANAHAFKRRNEICIYLNQSIKPPMSPTDDIHALNPLSKVFLEGFMSYATKGSAPSEKLEPSQGFSTLAEELNAICDGLASNDFSGQDILVEQFMRPLFVGFKDGPETIEWLHAYAQTRETLPKMLGERSILEHALEQWTCGSAQTLSQ